MAWIFFFNSLQVYCGAFTFIYALPMHHLFRFTLHVCSSVFLHGVPDDSWTLSHPAVTCN